MRKVRIQYLILIGCTILLGLLSRQISVVPLFMGDVLWAIMMFFIVRFIFIDVEIKSVGLTSLAICYMVELGQLYQAEWINSIRRTLPGRLILGQGFLWSDMIAYTVGIIVVTCVVLVRHKRKES